MANELNKPITYGSFSGLPEVPARSTGEESLQEFISRIETTSNSYINNPPSDVTASNTVLSQKVSEKGYEYNDITSSATNSRILNSDFKRYIETNLASSLSVNNDSNPNNDVIPLYNISTGTISIQEGNTTRTLDSDILLSEDDKEILRNMSNTAVEQYADQVTSKLDVTRREQFYQYAPPPTNIEVSSAIGTTSNPQLDDLASRNSSFRELYNDPETNNLIRYDYKVGMENALFTAVNSSEVWYGLRDRTISNATPIKTKYDVTTGVAFFSLDGGVTWIHESDPRLITVRSQITDAKETFKTTYESDIVAKASLTNPTITNDLVNRPLEANTVVQSNTPSLLESSTTGALDESAFDPSVTNPNGGTLAGQVAVAAAKAGNADINEVVRKNLENYKTSQASLENANASVAWGQFSNIQADALVSMYSPLKSFDISSLEPSTSGRPVVFFTKAACNPNEVQKINYAFSPSSRNLINSYLSDGSPYLAAEAEQYASGLKNFMMLLSNLSVDITVTDSKTGTFKAYETMEDRSITLPEYADHDEINSGTFTVDYVDVKGNPLLQLHKTWMEYYTLAYEGYAEPLPQAQEYGVLDYAVSAFSFMVQADSRSISYFEEYVGVFPIGINTSELKSGKGGQDKIVNLQVEYAYSFKRIYTRDILATFNWIANGNKEHANERLASSNDVLSGRNNNLQFSLCSDIKIITDPDVSEYPIFVYS